VANTILVPRMNGAAHHDSALRFAALEAKWSVATHFGREHPEVRDHWPSERELADFFIMHPSDFTGLVLTANLRQSNGHDLVRYSSKEYVGVTLQFSR